MSLRIDDGVRFRRVLDEGVMLRIDAGEIVGLNDVGARLVELVRDGVNDRAGLVAAIRAERAASASADVQADVDRFVDELVGLGALHEEAEQSGGGS